jgi:hypothetical protein
MEEEKCECKCEECFEGRHCGNTKCGVKKETPPPLKINITETVKTVDKFG